MVRHAIALVIGTVISVHSALAQDPVNDTAKQVLIDKYKSDWDQNNKALSKVIREKYNPLVADLIKYRDTEPAALEKKYADQIKKRDDMIAQLGKKPDRVMRMEISRLPSGDPKRIWLDVYDKAAKELEDYEDAKEENAAKLKETRRRISIVGGEMHGYEDRRDAAGKKIFDVDPDHAYAVAPPAYKKLKEEREAEQKKAKDAEDDKASVETQLAQAQLKIKELQKQLKKSKSESSGLKKLVDACETKSKASVSGDNIVKKVNETSTNTHDEPGKSENESGVITSKP